MIMVVAEVEVEKIEELAEGRRIARNPEGIRLCMRVYETTVP
jgi:hypothetical protein